MKQNKNHKNKPATMCDTWKISPLSNRFKSSAAMKSIYLLILLLFQTASTNTDCPSELDQPQVSAWCSLAVDLLNPIVFRLFLITFTFIFFIGFFLLYTHQSLQLHNPLISLHFYFQESFWAVPMCTEQKSDCHLFHLSRGHHTIHDFFDISSS